MQKINYFNSVVDVPGDLMPREFLKGYKDGLVCLVREGKELFFTPQDIVLRVVLQGLNSHYFIVGRIEYENSKKGLFIDKEPITIPASELIEVVVSANYTGKIIYSYKGDTLESEYNSVLSQYEKLLNNLRTIAKSNEVDLEGIVKQIDISADEIRRRRYYAEFFKSKIAPVEISDNAYAMTMVCVCCQIIVDNLEHLLDIKFLRQNVKHLSSKLIPELMRLIDQDLRSTAALEQFFALKDWFESQFEATFRVSQREEDERAEFYNTWYKMLDRLKIKLIGL